MGENSLKGTKAEKGVVHPKLNRVLLKMNHCDTKFSKTK